MIVTLPALDDEPCPHCGAANAGPKVYVWRVADERGLHYECACCARPFGLAPPDPPDV